MSNNTNSVKSTKSESPKTPGGISISLLTPCRRVGLSRSWRKKDPSPFISPLSNLSSSQPNTEEQSTHTPQARNSRKRKNDSPEKDSHKNEDDNDTSATNSTETENSQTPTRSNVIRKRSKTLLSKVTQNICQSHKETKQCNDNCEELNATKVSKLSRLKSIKSNKSKSPLIKIDKENQSKQISSTPETSKLESNSDKTKNKSPQNLTTECVVVIQKEIFKDNSQKSDVLKKDPKPSQILFDSDSDDIPLGQINTNTKDVSDKIEVQTISEEISNNSKTKNYMKKGNKVSKLEDKKTSTTDLKTLTKKSKLSRKSSKTEIKIESKPSSQSSFDDEDDDDFDHRKTIIVKKCYDKVVKPLKAKSTGSITDKDIEDLKNRIEVKKKLLLAKTLDSDTKDIRDLIKKWQKGCQDALLKLMELMKKKMPDQPKMENAQILDMLKIPADLVGYDSENDCFNSPNDTNIILSSLKI